MKLHGFVEVCEPESLYASRVITCMYHSNPIIQKDKDTVNSICFLRFCSLSITSLTLTFKSMESCRGYYYETLFWSQRDSRFCWAELHICQCALQAKRRRIIVGVTIWQLWSDLGMGHNVRTELSLLSLGTEPKSIFLCCEQSIFYGCLSNVVSSMYLSVSLWCPSVA